MAIASADGKRITVTIPTDGIVVAAEDALDSDRLVDVIWNGKPYLMFSQDLRDRSDPVY
jgi:hypothetical protein